MTHICEHDVKEFASEPYWPCKSALVMLSLPTHR